MCTVGGRIGWIVTRSGTARRPGIADPTTTQGLPSHAVAAAQGHLDHHRQGQNSTRPTPLVVT